MKDLCPCFDWSGHTYSLCEDGEWRCKFCYHRKEEGKQ